MEIASDTSRYRKLVSLSPSLRSYDAWAAKCYGEFLLMFSLIILSFIFRKTSEKEGLALVK